MGAPAKGNHLPPIYSPGRGERAHPADPRMGVRAACPGGALEQADPCGVNVANPVLVTAISLASSSSNSARNRTAAVAPRAITEGVLINDFSRTLSAVLRRLKALGIRIAMDDFGTGYSSLSYLQAFPFDKIKIDQTFISNLSHNSQSATIVRAVIGLARGLEVPVIAEGVETREQLEF